MGSPNLLRRLLMAALLGAAAVPPAVAQGAAPIRIGLIAPLSGGSADFGTRVRNGATLAVTEINAVGGDLGRPLELVVRDDKADHATGRAVAEDLKDPYGSVVSTFDRPFQKDDHDAFSDRMIWLGEWRGGRIVYHYPGDARLSAVLRRKGE